MIKKTLKKGKTLNLRRSITTLAKNLQLREKAEFTKSKDLTSLGIEKGLTLKEEKRFEFDSDYELRQ